MKGDPDAEAQLESVPTYVGTKADVYSLGVLLVVMMLRRMPWNYDVYAERWVWSQGKGLLAGCECGVLASVRAVGGQLFVVEVFVCKEAAFQPLTRSAAGSKHHMFAPIKTQSVSHTPHSLPPPPSLPPVAPCTRRLPALKAMKALYDLQMLHKVTWREGTPSSETFSPSLAALLDGMLDPNPVTRLTLEQVRASDWMREPMPHKLQVRTGWLAGRTACEVYCC
jgi:serine/threonine protein kinase